MFYNKNIPQRAQILLTDIIRVCLTFKNFPRCVRHILIIYFYPLFYNKIIKYLIKIRN